MMPRPQNIEPAVELRHDRVHARGIHHSIGRAQRRIRSEERRNTVDQPVVDVKAIARSEEPTSELQSLMRKPYSVFCLKKQKKNMQKSHINQRYVKQQQMK